MDTAALDCLESLLLAALPGVPDEARRLVHGRGRRWPGLEQVTVDWLQGVLLVALYRPLPEPAHLVLRERLQALVARPEWQQCAGRSLLLQQRHPEQAGSEWLAGPPCPEWTVYEDGLRYGLTLGSNQNTGLFLDMRPGRRWVREHSAGCRVLNLFAYTCGFSVAALAGGAASVVNLDMARGALARGRDNHRLNGLPLDRVRFLGHELFRSWGKLRRLGPYERIIIDPPSFQKGSFVLQQDYGRILRRLPDLLAPGGQVLACINDPGVGMDFLLECMAAEAPALQFAGRLANPPEFADADPQGGLKALLFVLAG